MITQHYSKKRLILGAILAISVAAYGELASSNTNGTYVLKTGGSKRTEQQNSGAAQERGATMGYGDMGYGGSSY